jgi:methyltransferase family protein
MLNRLRTTLWRARDAARDYLRPRHREEVFTRVYTQNLWGNAESRSGPGSSSAATAAVAAQLPDIWTRYGIRSLVDAPCGDCYWMSKIATALDRYVGVDIVPELIEANRAEHPALTFQCADLTRDVLPGADAILCRDCLQHLPTRLIQSALDRFKASGARWIFLTTNENVRANQDGVIGGSRPINLQLPPFNFPPPVEMIAEDGEGRYLALWRL